MRTFTYMGVVSVAAACLVSGFFMGAYTSSATATSQTQYQILPAYGPERDEVTLNEVAMDGWQFVGGGPSGFVLSK